MNRIAIAVLAAAGCLFIAAPALQAAPAASTLPQADLEEMLGPIALYPDSLVANVLAASVYPQEVAQAGKFVQGGGSSEALDKQPWEPPVQAVAKVPQVLSLLADNRDWTTAIGQAYLAQPADVTAAIQSLRAKAKANGALESNDQQTVVEQGSTIIIEPAEAEVIYVPQYNPQVVYVEHDPGWDAVAAGAISFGVGVAVGAIFNGIDCDWHGGCISWGHWGGYGGDIDIDRDVDISTGDINIGNRPRPGNEGQPWRPNRDKVATTADGRLRTDQLDKFRGDQGRQAMSDLRRPTAQPAPRPAQPGVRPGGGAAPTQQPLRKVSPPKAPAGGWPGAGVPSRTPSADRPATPQRPTAAPRQPSRTSTPSAFNRDGASQASRSRGSASRGGGGGSRSRGGRR